MTKHCALTQEQVRRRKANGSDGCLMQQQHYTREGPDGHLEKRQAGSDQHCPRLLGGDALEAFWKGRENHTAPQQTRTRTYVHTHALIPQPQH